MTQREFMENTQFYNLNAKKIHLQYLCTLLPPYLIPVAQGDFREGLNHTCQMNLAPEHQVGFYPLAEVIEDPIHIQSFC